MGIQHLCDEKLKEEDFNYFVENLKKFKITEKIDGSHLVAHLGQNVKSTTFSRGKKRPGGPQVTASSNAVFGSHFSKYINVITIMMSSGVIKGTPGTDMIFEVIDDPVTNVVPYKGKQIVILNPDECGAKVEPQEYDGWVAKINKPYIVDVDKVLNILKSNNDRKEALIALKSALLDMPSQYGDGSDESWIEGLVFSYGDRVYKLVNRDRFTVMNKFLHEFRNSLSSPKVSEKIEAGWFQEMRYEFASIYGYGVLATTQRSRWINKNPCWIDSVQTLDRLVPGTTLLSIMMVYEKHKSKLDQIVDDYMENYTEKYIDTLYGRRYIDRYTHQKNLDAISLARTRLKMLLDCITQLATDDSYNVLSVGNKILLNMVES